MKKEKKIITVDGAQFEEIVSIRKIQNKVKALAARVVEFHKNLPEKFQRKPPIFVVVLNGATYFWVDFSRCLGDLEFDHEMDIIKIESWGGKEQSSGKIVELVESVSANLKGRYVYIIEDIIDTCRSGVWLRDKYKDAGALDVKFISFLKKLGTAELEFEADFIGMEIENKFLIGYGLDTKQKKRELRSLYAKVD